MANPNPSPATRFGPGNPGGPGRPRGSASPTARLRQALDREAKLRDREPGHGITHLDLIVDQVKVQACRGDYRFIQLVFDRLEDESLRDELEQLRMIVDGERGAGAGDRPAEADDPGPAGGGADA